MVIKENQTLFINIFFENFKSILVSDNENLLISIKKFDEELEEILLEKHEDS